MRILFWFRKDLRLSDNRGLLAAASDSAVPPAVCYVSEPAILRRADMAPVRTAFVLESLADLRASIARCGGTLLVRHGDAAREIVRLAQETRSDRVYWNREYEPGLRARDESVKKALASAGIAFKEFDDRLIVAPGVVTTKDGRPHVVFTHFQRACLELPEDDPVAAVGKFMKSDLPSKTLATNETPGFESAVRPPAGGEKNARKRLSDFCKQGLGDYSDGRDFMAVDGTSRISVDLKFGTISVRTVIEQVRAAAGTRASMRKAAEKYISELRWRDFYNQILFHFPHVATGPFKDATAALQWEKPDGRFEAWKHGRTGFPIVDAAMRQLVSTGWMHNRARMIVASFLTKDLGISWQHGERFFMNHLVDGDLASNNGGWQWAASTGTDAAPYFRIFNPVLQSRRFDPEGKYIKKFCPELAGLEGDAVHAPHEVAPLELAAAGVRPGVNYPKPIVDHAAARDATLARFAKIKGDR